MQQFTLLAVKIVTSTSSCVIIFYFHLIAFNDHVRKNGIPKSTLIILNNLLVECL